MKPFFHRSKAEINHFAIMKTGKKILFLRSGLFMLLPGILFPGILAAQQREFTFNSPGSKCYFKYICFTADSNYREIKRPFVFVLGGENTTVQEVFFQDTLRKTEGFDNYYFVYLPDRGTTAGDKLGCVEALVSLLTYNYRYGRAN